MHKIIIQHVTFFLIGVHPVGLHKMKCSLIIDPVIKRGGLESH
jgi:hypothetical protein